AQLALDLVAAGEERLRGGEGSDVVACLYRHETPTGFNSDLGTDRTDVTVSDQPSVAHSSKTLPLVVVRCSFSKDSIRHIGIRWSPMRSARHAAAARPRHSPRARARDRPAVPRAP